jgi:hypothetical protein
LEVDATDDLEEDESPGSAVSHDDPDIANRAAEPEYTALSTTFQMFNLVATAYRTRHLEKNGFELVFV